MLPLDIYAIFTQVGPISIPILFSLLSPWPSISVPPVTCHLFSLLLPPPPFLHINLHSPSSLPSFLPHSHLPVPLPLFKVLRHSLPSLHFTPFPHSFTSAPSPFIVVLPSSSFVLSPTSFSSLCFLPIRTSSALLLFTYDLPHFSPLPLSTTIIYSLHFLPIPITTSSSDCFNLVPKNFH